MGENTTTRVQLELHAHQLKNVAGFGKGTSDPFAIVALLANDPTGKPKVLGKTEVIKNTLSPRWTTKFDLDYTLGSSIRINVSIWDEIRKGNNKPMGSALFEVGEVLGARGNTKAKKLQKGGTLFARITLAPVDNLGKLHLNIQGVKLKNVDGVFGKSDPFFEVSSRVDAAGGLTWQPIYRSKHVMNNLNPNWEPFSLDIARLCKGDLDGPIMIEIWDWDRKGKHTPMGKFETTVNALLKAQTTPSDTSKAFTALRSGKDFGKIVVTTAKLERYNVPSALSRNGPTSLGGSAHTVSAAATMSKMQTLKPEMKSVAYVPAALPPAMAPPPARPKFVDFLSGGCELELSIAIDFTGSNGDPRKPGTLHYRHPDGQLNDYEKAITAVGSIIARYDSDKKFPVFGFGAKYGGVIQHCFQVGEQPELHGINRVLEGYRGVFRTGLTMSGPTVFDEVISYAAAAARSQQEASKRIGKQSYRLLLILSDGAVTDLERTKRAIQAASDAPLSIVIVGIGNADFSAMQELDDYSPGRDIVQFVQFSDHANDRSSLTVATLEEIPDQLVDYFTGQGIMPLPPISGSQISLQAEDPTEEDIDLSLDINEEGEISLGNYDGPVYDDTQYATFAEYSSVKPLPVPATPFRQSAPYVTNQPPVVQPTPNVFHVQVPAKVAPGLQLHVQNPSTGQPMIVTVPQGVAPGGTFAVQY